MCQREKRDDRAARRADTIRRRMGWESGLLNQPGSKPKGMHWRTYLRLINQHHAYTVVSLEWLDKWVKKCKKKLDEADE